MTVDHPVSLWPDPLALGTVTDLYQLSMMAGYFEAGRADDHATFELFVRRLPEERAYLVFAGLEHAIGDLMRMAFAPDQIASLQALPGFRQLDDAFFSWLAKLRFECDVWSVPEGTIVFAGEPLVRVEGPLAQAQWVETFLIASLNYATLVATKAARMVEVSGGRSLIDFGARRGHGPQAGLIAARAAYLAGFEGTSHVEAAFRLGIPCVGTMAHSWVQAFAHEQDAFSTFARVFPETATLLVDTYETLDGIRRAAAIEPAVHGVRIDSGDLLALSKEGRRILDSAGRTDIKITASSDLNERRIQALVEAGAPIDAFGVGTDLITSRDAPALAMVYKLVAVNQEGRIKRSPGKWTYPFAKQLHRRSDAAGRFAGDRVTAATESEEGHPLLAQVLVRGELARPLPSLDAIRTYCRTQCAALPDVLRGPDACATYPVEYSDMLVREADRISALEL